MQEWTPKGASHRAAGMEPSVTPGYLRFLLAFFIYVKLHMLVHMTEVPAELAKTQL